MPKPTFFNRLQGWLNTWPLPAVMAWAASWGVFKMLAEQGAEPVLAIALATAMGVAFSLAGPTWWRRLLIGAGFPLSLVLSLPSLGLAELPAWGWLIPLLLLLLIYPINAWRDAPLFPTPPDALLALPGYAALPDGAQVLDAGCGAGDGLRALRKAYPQVALHGLEYSWPLRWVCAMRCPWARVRQGDIWLADWSQYDMVYVFQRPESMPRAVEKGAALRAGAWLVSLDFEAAGLHPQASYQAPGGKMVWLYQAPFVAV